jgi:succinate-semialdehyde dehydrogenase/glutarate-semialdehyde dehydrogenase
LGRLIIGHERIETGEKLASVNPATLETVGEVSVASSGLCRKAVGAAKAAFPAWRNLPPAEKMRIFHRAEEILARRAPEAARLITLEKGSPYPESLSVEVFGSLQALHYYAKNQGRLLKPKKAAHSVPLFLNKKGVYHFHPLGPTLIITPWNFPFLIPTCDVMSALTGGNTVVLRPSTTTPLTSLFLGEILIEAGLPPGVLNVVVCRVPQAEEMITHPDIHTVMFTGSVATGKRIMELASRSLTNVALELGGKDPAVVLKDADLDRASRGAVWTAFMNCGQSCGSIERLYVDEAVAEPFTRKVVEETRRLGVGNPIEPGIDMGPMANPGQLKVVEEHIADALSKGARVLTGGNRIQGLPGYFIEPTVLANVNHSMKAMTEETFGPTLPIMTFRTPDEAVALANDSIYGLTASVWTRDKKAAMWMAERLEAGSVTVNDHMYSFTEPKAIWGGIKQTGMGRSHGTYGLHELVNIKYIGSDFFKKKSQLWWFPYDEKLPHLMEKASLLYHDARLSQRLKAAAGILEHWPRIRKTSPVFNFVKSLPRILKK